MIKTATTLLITALTVFAQTDAPVPVYEEPPALKAADILKPEFAAGPNHRVLEQVTTFSGRNSYTIETKWGYYVADGDAMLLARIAEANAMAELQRYALTEEYKEALKVAANTPGYAERIRAMERASSLKETQAGIWSFIARGDEAVKGSVSNVPRRDNLTSSEQNSELSKTMRAIAVHFGTDPYSTNEVYERLLERFAWTSVCAKKTFTLQPGPMGNETGLALKAKALTQNFQEAVRDMPPKDLLAVNRRALIRMKVPAKDADAFLKNKAFSPTKQTAVVRALDALTDVENRESFVRLAAKNAVVDPDATFCAATAQLLATLHSGNPKLGKLAALGELPVAIATDGRLIIALRWDTAFWSYLAEHFIERASAAKLGQSGSITVIITGNATPRFKAELEKRKIDLITNVLGGPQK